MDRREVNQQWYSSFSEKDMTITIESGEDDGDLIIPVVFTVCGTCNGKGKHVNPSIDSNGLSAEDFEQDPDFREDYFSGLYDVPCNECHGKRVSPEVKWDALDDTTRKQVEERIEDHYAYQAECDMERRMGC